MNTIYIAFAVAVLIMLFLVRYAAKLGMELDSVTAELVRTGLSLDTAIQLCNDYRAISTGLSHDIADLVAEIEIIKHLGGEVIDDATKKMSFMEDMLLGADSPLKTFGQYIAEAVDADLVVDTTDTTETN